MDTVKNINQLKRELRIPAEAISTSPEDSIMEMFVDYQPVSVIIVLRVFATRFSIIGLHKDVKEDSFSFMKRVLTLVHLPPVILVFVIKDRALEVAV